MKLKLSLLLLLLSKLTFGQFTYQGKIIDVTSNQAIEGANIKIKGSERGVVSNKNGDFQIEISQLPTTLIISHIAYDAEEKLIEESTNKKESIYLLPKASVLSEITIVSKDEVKSMSDVEKYSIEDFEIIGNKIYRLEYHGAFKKYSLSITNLLGEVETSLKLANIKRIEGLYKSCIDNIYVVSASHAHLISDDEHKLELGSKTPIDTFSQFIKPCKLRKSRKLYYVNEFFNGLMSQISVYDIDKDEQKIVRSISNKTQLEHYKKDVAFVEESKVISNILTNSYAENQRIRAIQEDGDFLLTVFYKPEYPIYISKKASQLVLLNHIEKKIEIYKDDQLESEMEIKYVLDKKWLKEVRIDEATEKVYGIFDFKKGIGLKEIDVATGATRLVGILETNIQNYKSIRIHNGSVFYLKEDGTNASTMELLRYEM